MTTLQFADTHNLVAFLAKPAESKGFEQVATVKVKTVSGEQQLQALVDGKKIVVTEASVRRDLQLDDEEGTNCLPNATIFEELTRMGAKTTAWNEFSSTMASVIICLATNQTFNFSKYIFESMVKNLDNAGKFLMYPRLFWKETSLFPYMVVQAQEEMGKGGLRRRTPQSSVLSDPTNIVDEAVHEEPSMQLKELMDFCTKLQQRMLDLENTKTAQAQEITSLKKRVKKLEKKGGSRTHKLKRLYRVGRSARVVSSEEASLSDQEDASKQGRKIDDIDKDAEITLVDETQGRYGDEDMFRVNDLDGDEVVVESEVTDKVGEKISIVEEAVVVTDAVTIPVSAAIITNVELTLAQTLAELKSARPNTKGVVMQEPSESTPTISLQLPSQVKGQGSKDKGKAKMIEPDKPLKKKDQIKFDEEEALRLQAKFDEEDRLAREKAQQVEEANIAWDDIQAKIDADYQLAERLQAQEQQELTIEEKSTFLYNSWRKERSTLLLKGQKKREIDLLQELNKGVLCWKALLEETYRKSEVMEEISSKGAGDEPQQDSAMKQKMYDDQERAELQSLMNVIPNEEEIVVDVIPLATKPPRIIDKEDLETLWKLVKDKHGYTRPEEGYERVLWGDLKTMFEHHIEDAVWRNLRESKVLVWKLFNSCGVHFMRFQNLHVFMLVEKRYPLTPATITDMLNKKLQADHLNEMCYQLLKLITKQLKNQ
ncbi:hypothetical protein Tco_0704942 [Tanacetum coccineum]|uniref:Synaptobrevin, longin-like domain protein n=1 Tax=Tanacetum coccineum TaxID=301880 RepID=A0ABQ4Y3C8_9ASTR